LRPPRRRGYMSELVIVGYPFWEEEGSYAGYYVIDASQPDIEADCKTREEAKEVIETMQSRGK
jgi:hypothetical protein